MAVNNYSIPAILRSTLATGDIIYKLATSGWGRLALPSGTSRLGYASLISGGTGLPQWVVDIGPRGVNELRLSLSSSLAVTTADMTAIGTIYLNPYIGNLISLYNGSYWNAVAATSVSLALTITSGSNYDVFAYLNGALVALELSAAWTNDTTRATALTTQDGVWVKSGDATRRYIGTIRASGANTTEDSAANRFVWNAKPENRVVRPIYKQYHTGHTYNSPTIRQANGSNLAQATFVIGLAGDPIWAWVWFDVGTENKRMQLGPGLDSVTAMMSSLTINLFYWQNNTLNNVENQTPLQMAFPVAGYHYVAALESATESALVTINYLDVVGWVMG